MVSAFLGMFGSIRPGWQDEGHGATLFELEQLLVRPRPWNEARIRALCHSVWLGDDTVLCRVLGRYKMFVDASDHGLSPHLMLDGYWEMWLTEALTRAVRPGMTVIDVGANLGYFTLLMADLVGPQGRVHAFEPNAPIAARLKRSVSLNGFADRTVVYECALGDSNGREMMLVCPLGEPKNAHLIDATGSERVSGVSVVATRRLDSLSEIAHADVIKIDADTAEEAIWHGMTGLLDCGRAMKIFLEFAAARYAAPSAFLEDIESAGFSVQRLDLDRGVRPVSLAEILGAPPQIDQMLVLSR